MKNYKVSVQDREYNELTVINISANNKKDANRQRIAYKTNCKINDAKHFYFIN